MVGMGKPAVAIELSLAERRELQSLARAQKTGQAMARRARIALAASAGRKNKAICIEVGADANTWASGGAKASVPANLDVHLVMDNNATHKSKPIRDWLAKRPRWHVHFTPTGASWINQVERFFALITEKQIQALESDIRTFIDAHDADPKPFRWTRSADGILAAIQRFCARTPQIKGTTESGH
jgi:hypothetical protein